MQKGYKREGKGLAILRFFIGIFIIIVVVALAYFMLQMDYSDKINEGSEVRSFTEQGPAPETIAIVNATESPEDIENAEATAVPTPAPTEEPTPVPTAEPTPEPTPEPTNVPQALIAQTRSDLKLPKKSLKAMKIGVTEFKRSELDDNRVVYISGFAYINDESFDGANCDVYLTVTQATSKKSIVALATKTEGISGLPHEGATCANVTASDWEVYLDVTQYPDEIYSLGIVLAYEANGKKTYEYLPIPNSSMTILSSKITNDIVVVTEG